jgi:hypothetical protein
MSPPPSSRQYATWSEVAGTPPSKRPRRVPGAAASNVVHPKSPRDVSASPKPAVLDNVKTTVLMRRGARGFPPRQPSSSIGRTTSVPRTNTKANVVPMARAVVVVAPAARQTGTAMSENAQATTSSPSRLFSRSAAIAPARRAAVTTASDVTNGRIIWG